MVCQRPRANAQNRVLTSLSDAFYLALRSKVGVKVKGQDQCQRSIWSIKWVVITGPRVLSVCLYSVGRVRIISRMRSIGF